MMKHQLQTKGNQSGFSLVETLVAITILLIVIVGPLSISSQSARSTSFASEQVIAFFLAQEGIEIVQKARDDIVIREIAAGSSDIDPITDMQGLYGGCFSTNGCNLSLSNNPAEPIDAINGSCGTNGIGCTMFFDDSSTSTLRSRYTAISQAGFLSSPYSRSIVIEPIPGRQTKEARVTSTVYWRTSDQREVQLVSVETYIFNIYGD
jgi:prepilin-type N-terminal cleavage/methylation domain-containing protein